MPAARTATTNASPTRAPDASLPAVAGQAVAAEHDERGAGPRPGTADAGDDRARAIAGQAAVKRLGAPVRSRLRLGQALVVVSGLLSIAPYVALVQLGDILLAAHDAGADPDPERVRATVMVLIGAYSTRLLLYSLALLITHFADLALRDRLRRDIVARLARTPLSWFTSSTSGRLRKAVQDDTTTVHTVIAHGPVERLNAVVTPVALLACAFWIDWRLGLLSIGTIPLFFATYSLSMRGMNEKTMEMDRRLENISSAMVEFVAGIGVVKAFGRVGRAHAAYLRAGDEFSTFYRAWAMSMMNISCLSITWVSIPVLLLVNLGGGALLAHAGAVTLPQMLTTTLIALVLPGAMVTIASVSWSYQQAGAAALRLCDILDAPTLPAAVHPRRPDGARVEIEHVSYSYGDTLAVDDACLTLKP
uniref:ABC transporter transmembrane domain-containing protein n=1 Tax=Actinomyces qiguomingii TaxID=2057800 RepID=UPI0011AF14F8